MIDNIEKLKQYLKVIKISCEKSLEIIENSPELISKLSYPVKWEPDWEDWPEAVPHFLIPDTTPATIVKRARAILNRCDLVDLRGKHFLDFGCGNGSIAKEAIARGVESSTGFDIDKQWDVPIEGVFLTTDYNKLEKSFYDIILLYDVLDHSSDPLTILQQVKELLKEGGDVKIRCHPYTSRHANHVYTTFNKAFSHFFLTPEQLQDHNPLPLYEITGVNPLDEYRRWFNSIGFVIVKEDVISTPVDKKCLKNVPRQKLKEIINHEDYVNILSLDFVDYWLKHE